MKGTLLLTRRFNEHRVLWYRKPNQSITCPWLLLFIHIWWGHIAFDCATNWKQLMHTTFPGLLQYTISVRKAYPNPPRSRLPRTPILWIVKSFWEFAQSTTLILPCYVQNFKTTLQLDKRGFARFEFKVRFGKISLLQHPPEICTKWVHCYALLCNVNDQIHILVLQPYFNGTHMIAPVPVKWHWRIGVHKSRDITAVLFKIFKPVEQILCR